MPKKKTTKKKTTKKKTSKKRTYQTGTSKKSYDKRYRAKKPGKRVSKSGKVYYERRANRSDKNPRRKL